HARRRADLAARRAALPRLPADGRHAAQRRRPRRRRAAIRSSPRLGDRRTPARRTARPAGHTRHARGRPQPRTGRHRRQPAAAPAARVLALPTSLPVAAWWLTGPASRLLAPFPTYWIVRSWQDTDPTHLLAGLACLTAWLIPLTHRVTRTLR